MAMWRLEYLIFDEMPESRPRRFDFVGDYYGNGLLFAGLSC